jgi:UDP-3-O-[3-hydroxymyristoyl] glucosamine N-acyltransferase
VILGEDAAPAPCAMLRARDPYLAFAMAAGLLAPDDRPAPGVAPSAHIGPGAAIGPGCYIGPFALVGDGAVIGARTIVHPHAVIYGGVTIGDDCVIHAHASIRERCQVGNRVIPERRRVAATDSFAHPTVIFRRSRSRPRDRARRRIGQHDDRSPGRRRDDPSRHESTIW